MPCEPVKISDLRLGYLSNSLYLASSCLGLEMLRALPWLLTHSFPCTSQGFPLCPTTRSYTNKIMDAQWKRTPASTPSTLICIEEVTLTITPVPSLFPNARAGIVSAHLNHPSPEHSLSPTLYALLPAPGNFHYHFSVSELVIWGLLYKKNNTVFFIVWLAYLLNIMPTSFVHATASL